MSTEPKPKRQPGPQNLPLLQPDSELARIVGHDPLPRTKIVRGIWAYIHANGLQDKQEKRFINPNETLGRVLGPSRIDMFAMQREISKHVTPVPKVAGA